jgi:hypothetical protein
MKNTQPISNATDRERHESLSEESQRGPDKFVRSEYGSTKFLALDKCLPGRKYLEVTFSFFAHRCFFVQPLGYDRLLISPPTRMTARHLR